VMNINVDNSNPLDRVPVKGHCVCSCNCNIVDKTEPVAGLTGVAVEPASQRLHQAIQTAKVRQYPQW
jgi:hypothetical protein